MRLKPKVVFEQDVRVEPGELWVATRRVSGPIIVPDPPTFFDYLTLP